MRNAVYVIGAGASHETNLPTGSKLIEIIAEKLNIRFDFHTQVSGDHQIGYALEDYTGRQGMVRYVEKSYQIRDGMQLTQSIDNYIDSHRDDDEIAFCGKLAIVSAILDAERKSKLYISPKAHRSELDLPNLSSTWYSPFFKLLSENCTKEEIVERFETVSLIVFNYDRCVEHFLYHALQVYYRVNPAEAAAMMTSLNIYHPYGSVGDLSWVNGDTQVDFGARVGHKQLLEYSAKIKTFTESQDPETTEIDELREKMQTAHQVVFLGFAYHKQNLRLIAPDHAKLIHHNTVYCYGSTLGMSSSDVEVISDDIGQMYNKRAGFRTTETTCHSFFGHFWRSLAF